MSLFAEIVNGRVARVVVCDSVQWVQSTLGGSWVATDDSRTSDEQYAGIGMGYDALSTARFAPQFRQPAGSDDAYEIGATAFHAGRVWQNIHDGNDRAPGEFGWVSREGELRRWREGDTFARDAECLYARRRWRSRVNGNRDEPTIGNVRWAVVAREVPPTRTEGR